LKNKLTKSLLIFAIIALHLVTTACAAGVSPTRKIIARNVIRNIWTVIEQQAKSTQSSHPKLVAHAGGIVDGYAGTNSMEALVASAEQGYTLIEVDILTTTDGFHVLAHDWEYMSNRTPLAPNTAVTKAEFMQYEICNKYTPVALEDLIFFLDKHPKVRIITDTKDRDYSALEVIATQHPAYRARFIPQVYLFEDYATIKALGYQDIIVTVYAMTGEIKATPQVIGEKALELGVYAITIPDELLTSKEYINALQPEKVKYFAHTINTPGRAQELLNYGIHGVYTDTLLLKDDEFMTITTHLQESTEKLNAINSAINNLSPEEKAMLEDTLIFKAGSEFMIRSSIAEVIQNTPTVNCFEAKDVFYLPLRKVIESLGAKSILYLPEGAIQFEYEGGTYRLVFGRSEVEKMMSDEVVVVQLEGVVTTFQNTAFVPSDLVEAMGLHVVSIGKEHIIITRKSGAPEVYGNLLAKIGF
jgi:Glycerophosphoryl diester phosphodiesterase